MERGVRRTNQANGGQQQQNLFLIESNISGYSIIYLLLHETSATKLFDRDDTL